MSEVQLFPQPGSQGRSPWSEEELTEAVEGASPHVRFLLKELSVSDDVPARELKSKRVAYAIVQRICNSQNKDSLVLSRETDRGEKTYRLNPSYRDALRPLVATANEPPPSPPKPPRKKNPGLGRGRRGKMSAMDGIASSGVTLAPRSIAQSTGGRSIVFPRETPLEFCQELMGFLNSTSNTRYRVVLDASGPRLELG